MCIALVCYEVAMRISIELSVGCGTASEGYGVAMCIALVGCGIASEGYGVAMCTALVGCGTASEGYGMAMLGICKCPQMAGTGG